MDFNQNKFVKRPHTLDHTTYIIVHVHTYVYKCTPTYVHNRSNTMQLELFKSRPSFEAT